MPRCRVDSTLERTVKEGFSFPLGVYPVEEMTPKAGYTVEFEAADGADDDDEQWEEWPDRYVFDIVITSERLEPLVRSLVSLLPGRVYPILDYLGLDAYREVDPYIAYELVGLDRFTDALRRYRGFFFEDGLCGFGAMSDDPFLYIFVDEHKIVTVRVEPDLKEKIEKLLHAFDLEVTEGPAGADAAAHEHRGVLSIADDRPDLLTSDEIVEQLRDEWRLTLNIDRETNLDEEGHELGPTAWHCLVRCAAAGEERCRYLDVLLTAASLGNAETMAADAAEESRPKDVEEWEDVVVIQSDRLNTEMLAEALRAREQTPVEKPSEERIMFKEWLE
jgi:hypothetical protein